MAPADIPVLWLISYGISIIGAAEVCGLASTALVNAALCYPLTAVWNRVGVNGQARRVLTQARRRHEPIAVIVLDFNDFKSVNDRDGHSAGDAALGDFSDLVVERLPKAAVFGRLGGDEFVVILGGYDAAAARELALTLIEGTWCTSRSVSQPGLLSPVRSQDCSTPPMSASDSAGSDGPVRTAI